jgi:hypothetical protein
MRRAMRSLFLCGSRAGGWAWGVATMCLARPVEGQVHVVIQWVVRTERAVGEAMGAMQDTNRLQRLLQQAFSDAYPGSALGNLTNHTVGVRNVTVRMLDESKRAPAVAGATPIPTPTPTPTGAAQLETDTVVIAAIGGMTLVGVAWVLSRRPWAVPKESAAPPLLAPVLRVRIRRE